MFEHISESVRYDSSGLLPCPSILPNGNILLDQRLSCKGSFKDLVVFCVIPVKGEFVSHIIPLVDLQYNPASTVYGHYDINLKSAVDHFFKR